ncbi:MAG: hypothetical protein HC871_07120 [Rhizobiales bacterium]|nr:hypothetical protein [Hyphomicrobiales bacterium]
MLERAILETAWQIIEDTASWTQSASARDQEGAQVQPDDPAACCWCAIGAIEKAVADMNADEALVIPIVEHLCTSAKVLFGTRSINYVNDHMDHAAVRRLFEHAIADCRLVEAAGATTSPPRPNACAPRSVSASAISTSSRTASGKKVLPPPSSTRSSPTSSTACASHASPTERGASGPDLPELGGEVR